MANKISRTLTAAGVAFSLTLPVQVATSTMFFPSQVMAADKALPAPYISKALDAVLIPINADVRKAFGMKKKKKGVLVLAVQPGGEAEKQGLKVGDVIAAVKDAKSKGGAKSKGKKVKSPKKLDAAILYWIKQGKEDFLFVGSSGGKKMSKGGKISAASFSAAIDVASVSSWASATSSSTSSFSYSSYVESFSSEMTASYEAWDEELEELLTDDAFEEDMAEAEEDMTEEEEAAEDEEAEDDADDEEEDGTGDDGEEEDEEGDDEE